MEGKEPWTILITPPSILILLRMPRAPGMTQEPEGTGVAYHPHPDTEERICGDPRGVSSEAVVPTEEEVEIGSVETADGVLRA